MASIPTGHFGVHLTLDGYGGSPGRLRDRRTVLAWLEEMPEILGMTKLAAPLLVEVEARTEKDPGGVTGVVLVAQSHLSVHTFPRRGFVSADVYTCHDHIDAEAVEARLAEVFELDDVETHLIRRGTRYPQVDLHPHPADEERG